MAMQNWLKRVTSWIGYNLTTYGPQSATAEKVFAAFPGLTEEHYIEARNAATVGALRAERANEPDFEGSFADLLPGEEQPEDVVTVRIRVRFEKEGEKARYRTVVSQRSWNESTLQSESEALEYTEITPSEAQAEVQGWEVTGSEFIGPIHFNMQG